MTNQDDLYRAIAANPSSGMNPPRASQPPDPRDAEIAAVQVRVADLEKRMQQMELRAWNTEVMAWTAVGHAGF